MPRLAPVTRRTGAGTVGSDQAEKIVVARSLSGPASAALKGPPYRIDRCWQFVPDLDLVAVRIGREQIRLARHELAPLLDFPAGSLHRARRRADVLRTLEAKTEVRDAARLARLLLLLLEHEHVARSRGLQLNEAVLLVHLDGAEHLTVELRRAIHIAHRERHVRQSVGLHHRRIT